MIFNGIALLLVRDICIVLALLTASFIGLGTLLFFAVKLLETM